MNDREYPIQNVPQCLRELDQWVCWKIIIRDGKETKVPIDAKSGAFAKTSDPATWSDFATAWDCFQNTPAINGVGFVFTADDPFAGVDMDDCLTETGDFIWGEDIVKGLSTYSEVSPSGRGVKMFLQGSKPAFANCRKDGFGPLKIGKVEVYDQGRFFVVTGQRLPDASPDVESRESDLTGLCQWLWPEQGNPPESKTNSSDSAFAACLATLLALTINDHSDGSHRLFVACCRCVEHDLSDGLAIRCIRQYAAAQPFPKQWTDSEITRRIRDAEKECVRASTGPAGQSKADASFEKRFQPQFKRVGELLDQYPVLREPLIEGLLRVGETMNVIAPPKLGKSWLVMDLAMAVATGRKWLDSYETVQGNVLVLDNELHHETSASRIPKVAAARKIPIEDICSTMFIDNLRGRLPDINDLRSYFREFKPGFFKMIVMDAFYRFMPKDTDENSNGNLTDLYNTLDSYAAQLECSFVLVHHASKGNQSGKSVTDVGAGAGSQSRATDTHLVLRHHREPGCVVVDAAVRSWPPIEPKCLRWEFPVWLSEDLLDPTELKLERPTRKTKSEATPKQEWTSQTFAKTFVCEEPKLMHLVRRDASKAGLSQRQIKELQADAEDAELIFRWKYGASKPEKLALVRQPSEDF